MDTKLRVDTRKWIMSKLKPKKYGERLELDGNITIDLAARLASGRQRALEARECEVIENG